MRIWLFKKYTIVVFIGILFVFLYLYSGSIRSNVPKSLIRDNQNVSIIKNPLILMYTPIFGVCNELLLSGCPFKDRCDLTFNKSRMDDADVVVYHAYDLPDQYPRQNGKKRYKNVFYTQENPISVKAFAKSSPKNFFHWILSYASNGDAFAPYGGVWVAPETAKQQKLPPLQLPFDAETIYSKKSIDGAFWLVSNCNTSSKRENAVTALANHFRVDIAGKCATNDTLKSLCPKGEFCHQEFEKYYFFMALENADCVDYVTEKYWDRYALPVVPIVMRRYIYEKKIPPKSFIAFDDYASPKAMADHLKHLIGNKTAYLEYFEYRKLGWTRPSWNADGYTFGICGLCKKLLSPQTNKTIKLIKDVKKHFANISRCEESAFTDKWIQQ